MGDSQPIRAVEVGRAADSLSTRKRAAVELISCHERTLRRTARRFSLCADDAEDAFQRALEILLTKAPTSNQRELIRWMQTVTKHEALAVRRNRERNLGTPSSSARGEEGDWVQLIPSEKDGPADEAVRRERIARAREALKALKPQELRALTLLAQGYSYAEIGEITGWTYTKVNRCLAEGRERFRAVVGSIEDGRRCQELAPTLSAFVDGEANSHFTAQLLAHLKECGHCQAKMRAFRAAPRAAAVLAPVVPIGKTFTGRIHELVGALQSRMPGRTNAAETAVNQLAAAGGTKGSGMALAAKVLTACVGTAGGAAACVAAGVVPPAHIGDSHAARHTIEKAADQGPQELPETTTNDEQALVPQPGPDPAPQPEPTAQSDPAPTAQPPPPPTVAAEFSPEASVATTATQSSAGEFGGSPSGGSNASAPAGASGEFGP